MRSILLTTFCQVEIFQQSASIYFVCLDLRSLLYRWLVYSSLWPSMLPDSPTFQNYFNVVHFTFFIVTLCSGGCVTLLAIVVSTGSVLVLFLSSFTSPSSTSSISFNVFLPLHLSSSTVPISTVISIPFIIICPIYSFFLFINKSKSVQFTFNLFRTAWLHYQSDLFHPS